MLEVRFLGRFEVKYKNKPLAISSRPAQSLFAYLVLNAGAAYRREKLAGLLWPDSLETTARENLRHALWRLRKALLPKSKVEYLLTDDLSIAFNDASEFWSDASELKKLDDNSSADELIYVLAFYQGELLPGFYEEWVALEREHLGAIFEHQMARLLAFLQEDKRWQDVLDWAERWIRLGQKPEPAFRALMLAHSAKGDMSKVAAAYERCVKSLKEFGVEPSEQTRTLYGKLKAGKEIPETGPSLVVEEKRAKPPKTNVPIPITSFIGRGREMEEVRELLSSTRLLTLTGSGGIGKTRLAVESVRRLVENFRDGVWYVELASVTEGHLIPQAIAQVLGVRESSSQSMKKTLQDYLREKHLLLVLDNCEQVISACAQLTEFLLSTCAHLKIIATSREALGIMGETTLQVPVLSFPTITHLSQIQNLKEFESIELFTARAAALHPTLALTAENIFAVTQICQRLDGIPLAIELAAARIKIFSLEEIAARLDDRFSLLTQGSRTALPRHQTLRALIEWSYDLLSEEERILWGRLSVFVNGWTLGAAEQICADERVLSTTILELLSHLVDKSIVIVDERGGSSRFYLLETLRQFGKEILQVSGEDIALHKRYVAFYLGLTEKATSWLLTVEQKKWFKELDIEYGNIRSALEWAMNVDIVSALRMAAMLGQYWEVRGYISEGRTTIERALSLAQDVPKEVNADALRWQAKFTARQGDYEHAKELLEESLMMSRGLGDKPGITRSLHNFGMVLSLQGDYPAAKVAYEESLVLLKEIGDKREIAALTTSLGNVANYLGDYETARRYQEESVSIFRELGDKFGLFIALNNLGFVLEREGDNSTAKRYYEESIATAYDLGEKNLVAYALNGLAHLFYLEKDLAEAKRNYRESLLISQEIGEKRCMAYCLEGFAKLALQYGNAERAAHLLGAAESLRSTVGAPLIQVEQSELERDVANARGQVGEKAFETLFRQGESMTLDQAVAFALQGADQ